MNALSAVNFSEKILTEKWQNWDAPTSMYSTKIACKNGVKSIKFALYAEKRYYLRILHEEDKKTIRKEKL